MPFFTCRLGSLELSLPRLLGSLVVGGSASCVPCAFLYKEEIKITWIFLLLRTYVRTYGISPFFLAKVKIHLSF